MKTPGAFFWRAAFWIFFLIVRMQVLNESGAFLAEAVCLAVLYFLFILDLRFKLRLKLSGALPVIVLSGIGASALIISLLSSLTSKAGAADAAWLFFQYYVLPSAAPYLALYLISLFSIHFKPLPAAEALGYTSFLIIYHFAIFKFGPYDWFGFFIIQTLLLISIEGKSLKDRIFPLIILALCAGGGAYKLWKSSIVNGGGLFRMGLSSFQMDVSPGLYSEIQYSDNLLFLAEIPGEFKRYYLKQNELELYDPATGLIGPGKAGDIDHTVREREEYLMTIFSLSSIPVFRGELEEYSKQSESEYLCLGNEFIGPRFQLLRLGLEVDFGKEWTDYGGNQRIEKLALDITNKLTTVYAKAQAIERYFKEEYFYTLNPGSSDKPLENFIFVSKKGYCIYFAQAFVLMVRSLGIPARLCLGFVTDPAITSSGLYGVFGHQAHAWAEVYFAGFGWVTFDPTSSSVQPGEGYPHISYDLSLIDNFLGSLGRGADGDLPGTKIDIDLRPVLYIILIIVIGLAAANIILNSFGSYKRRVRFYFLKIGLFCGLRGCRADPYLAGSERYLPALKKRGIEGKSLSMTYERVIYGRKIGKEDFQNFKKEYLRFLVRLFFSFFKRTIK